MLKAIRLYEQTLKLAREIGDRRGEAAAIGYLVLAYSDMGNNNKAIKFYKQQLSILLEIGDRRGKATVLGNLGIAYKDLGDVHKASVIALFLNSITKQGAVPC